MSKSSPQVIIPSLATALEEEGKRQLAAIKPTVTSLPDDRIQHKFGTPEEVAAKNFDQKIYMFPESYNQLRKELVEHWPHTWAQVSWAMAYKAEDFVATMNEALDMKLQFDTGKVEAICLEYLNALRKLRGVSPFGRA